MPRHDWEDCTWSARSWSVTGDAAPVMGPIMGPIMGRSVTQRVTFAGSVLGCMLGAMLIFAGNVGSAIAGDDDDPEDQMPDTQLVHGIMQGLGLRHDGDAIEYRERSPLVIPQNLNLPPPESAAAVKHSADWPVDPDAKKAKIIDKSKRKAAAADVTERSRPLRPNEMTTSGVDAKSSSVQSSENPGTNGMNPSNPTQLGFTGFSFDSIFGAKPSAATFTSEPVRSSLTDPPDGYRTPAPNQPYGVADGKQGGGPTQAYDFFTKHGEANPD